MIWKYLNNMFDDHWSRLTYLDRIIFVYAMGMFGIMGLLLLRFIIVNKLV